MTTSGTKYSVRSNAFNYPAPVEAVRLSSPKDYEVSADLWGNLVIVNKSTKVVRSNTWLAQPSDETGPNRWLGVFSDFHAMNLFLDVWLSLRASLETDDPAFIYTMLVLPHQADGKKVPPEGVSNPILPGIRHSWLAFPPAAVPRSYFPNTSHITIILFDYSHNVSLRLNRTSIPDPTLPILPFHRNSRFRINPEGEYTHDGECMYWMFNGLPAWKYSRPAYDRHAHMDDRLKEWISSAFSSRGVPKNLPAWAQPGFAQQHVSQTCKE